MRQREQDAFRHSNKTGGGPETIEVLENRAWTNYCNYSLMELLYVQPVCEAMVERIEEGWRDLKDEWLEQREETNNTHEAMGEDSDNGGEGLNVNGKAQEDITGDVLSSNIGEDMASPSGDSSSVTAQSLDDDGAVNGEMATSIDETGSLNSGVADSASIGGQNDDKDDDHKTDTDSRQPSSGVITTTLPQDDLEQLAALVAENKTLYELIDFYSELTYVLVSSTTCICM